MCVEDIGDPFTLERRPPSQTHGLRNSIGNSRYDAGATGVHPHLLPGGHKYHVKLADGHAALLSRTRGSQVTGAWNVS
jgi:hypothetical protein